MKKTQTVIKVNEIHEISVVQFEDGTYSIAHMENGQYSESLISDPKETKFEDEKQEMIQDLACEILESELTKIGFDCTLECDSQIIVETFSYNVWIAVGFYNNKLSYGCSTIFTDSEESEDKNVVERKTYKGLVNYLKRFDK